jgi:hypothetical protein
MDQDLQSLCEAVFDTGVETLFQEILKGRHDGVFEAPLIGGLWAIADAGKAKRAARRAALARAWWSLHGPSWSPPLRVSGGEMDKLQNDELIRIRFVGDYAGSLCWSDWDFRIHPSFYDWCCNFVAIRPDFLPLVPELKLRPKKLPGYNPRIHCWEPPDRTRIETGIVRR